jgi:pilus assembly protein Flp/PilA
MNFQLLMQRYVNLEIVVMMRTADVGNRNEKMWARINKRNLRDRLVQFAMNDSGATAIEYGLITALIAVTAITVLQGVGSKLNRKFISISNGLN